MRIVANGSCIGKHSYRCKSYHALSRGMACAIDCDAVMLSCIAATTQLPFPALILPVPMSAAGPSIRTWRIIMLQSMSRKRGSKSLLVSTKVWIHVVFSMAGVGNGSVAELNWVGEWWNEPGEEENWGDSMILRRFVLELLAFFFQCLWKHFDTLTW